MKNGYSLHDSSLTQCQFIFRNVTNESITVKFAKFDSAREQVGLRTCSTVWVGHCCTLTCTGNSPIALCTVTCTGWFIACPSILTCQRTHCKQWERINWFLIVQNALIWLIRALQKASVAWYGWDGLTGIAISSHHWVMNATFPIITLCETVFWLNRPSPITA